MKLELLADWSLVAYMASYYQILFCVSGPMVRDLCKSIKTTSNYTAISVVFCLQGGLYCNVGILKALEKLPGAVLRRDTASRTQQSTQCSKTF